MKYLVFYLVALELGLTLPAVAQSQTFQSDRFDNKLAQSSPGRYSRLSLGYPTPITDQYGIDGLTPNIQEWYARVLAKMRSTPASTELPQPTPQYQLNAPEGIQQSSPEAAPSQPIPQRGGSRGGSDFTPTDRGAPDAGGAGGARFRPATIPQVVD